MTSLLSTEPSCQTVSMLGPGVEVVWTDTGKRHLAIHPGLWRLGKGPQG